MRKILVWILAVTALASSCGSGSDPAPDIEAGLDAWRTLSEEGLLAPPGESVSGGSPGVAGPYEIDWIKILCAFDSDDAASSPLADLTPMRADDILSAKRLMEAACRDVYLDYVDWLGER